MAMMKDKEKKNADRRDPTLAVKEETKAVSARPPNGQMMMSWPRRSRDEPRHSDLFLPFHSFFFPWLLADDGVVRCSPDDPRLCLVEAPFPPVRLSVYPSLCLSLCPSVCLSVRLSLWQAPREDGGCAVVLWPRRHAVAATVFAPFASFRRLVFSFERGRRWGNAHVMMT